MTCTRPTSGGGTWPGRVIFYFLDIALKGDNAANARQIVQALGEIRDGKSFNADAREGRYYTDIEDRAANAWKFRASISRVATRPSKRWQLTQTESMRMARLPHRWVRLQLTDFAYPVSMRSG